MTRRYTTLFEMNLQTRTDSQWQYESSFLAGNVVLLCFNFLRAGSQVVSKTLWPNVVTTISESITFLPRKMPDVLHQTTVLELGLLPKGKDPRDYSQESKA